MDSIARKIQTVLLDRDIKQTELCRKLNWNDGNFRAKLNRDTFKTDFLEQIANALDYDLEINFVDREKGYKI